MSRPRPLYWAAAIDAYGITTGPDPSDVADGADEYTADRGLVCRGAGVTPEEAMEAARARWRRRLPEVKGLLWDLQRAARAEVDVEDQEIIRQLRLLTGSDPTSEAKQSIPALAVSSWVSLMQEIVRAHGGDPEGGGAGRAEEA